VVVGGCGPNIGFEGALLPPSSTTAKRKKKREARMVMARQ
jgi:hypothetical protein